MTLFKRCLPLFHDYGKWKIFRQGKVLDGDSGKSKGYFIEQTRICERCGKVQLREVRT